MDLKPLTVTHQSKVVEKEDTSASFWPIYQPHFFCTSKMAPEEVSNCRQKQSSVYMCLAQPKPEQEDFFDLPVCRIVNFLPEKAAFPGLGYREVYSGGHSHDLSTNLQVLRMFPTSCV